MRKTGTYQASADLRFFVPYPLPPKDPPLELNGEITALSSEASFALGQLNELSERLPDPERFIRAYVIKEALLSSAIEGVHTTLVDVFTQSIDDDAKPNKETNLVLNYTRALEDALRMIQGDGLPISTRVILAAHKTLMTAGQEAGAAPGQFRKQSVRVGEFVPPAAPEIPRLMGELENYINELEGLPDIIKAGLVHVQFETIHPFLDGNGRIGRMLIVLMLVYDELLNTPVLYPSYYFKKRRLEYYQRLDRVHTQGDFEGWVAFYLRVIRDSAVDAYSRAKDIEALELSIKETIQNKPDFVRTRETALAAIGYLFCQPVTTITAMSETTGKVYNTTQNILREFMGQGWVSENIISERNRRYRFDPYLALLEKDYA